MARELVASYEGREVGRVSQRSGRLSFTYDERWQEDASSFPLSISMPLAARVHEHAKIDTFLWGLLPDNDRILGKWAQKFGVSARNAFGLISYVGEDCAGAVQFSTPERMAEEPTDEVAWLTEHDVAERLRALEKDHSAWRRMDDVGQFSLAGAKPKVALLLDGDHWGIPSGRTPTTHILKPGIVGLDGSAENEHLCLTLARTCGIPAARSAVRRFEDQMAIVVERYDRVREGSSLRRVHQEDLCQALGLMPSAKYQNEGGPGVLAIVELLRQESRKREEDIETFLDAQSFNWLIAGTDAHAKNYSVLIGAGGARLAPLYDVASALPYPDMEFRRLKLAMKLGDEYRLSEIGIHEWWKLCKETKQGWAKVVERILRMAKKLIEQAPAQLARCRADGLEHETLSRLTESLIARAESCARLFESAASYRG